MLTGTLTMRLVVRRLLALANSDVTGVMDHRESIQEGNSALGQVVERIST